jgi:hypothetical protein
MVDRVALKEILPLNTKEVLRINSLQSTAIDTRPASIPKGFPPNHRCTLSALCSTSYLVEHEQYPTCVPYTIDTLLVRDLVALQCNVLVFQ